MTLSTATRRDRLYASLTHWMAGEQGRVGLERLRLLGAFWERPKAHLIVEGMSKMEGAPPLPRLDSYRTKAAFLAGSCWTLALLASKSRNQP